jgi:hypothetical protein
MPYGKSTGRIGFWILIAAVCIVPLRALAQPSPPLDRSRSMIVPADPKTEEMMRSLEAQRPAFEAYQKCVAEHRREVDLHYAAAEVIQFRDQRAMMEAALKQDSRARQQYPGGVDQLTAVAFARYKSLGGTAASIPEVQGVATPCEVPGQLKLPQASGTSAPVLIRDSQRLVVPSPTR